MKRTAALALTLALTLLPSAAMAQGDVAQAPEENRWVPLAIMTVLGVGVLVASFLGSRRGHRD